ncbi:P2Y purinoceptor 1-like [Pristis pectinata]|uniref:P2Y purinoceptor 1-like n=1 Tax=Pristis pectinata TaxID=685728 RepID=UPI00223DA834|nr:P2Y purinoceptor 1-like [Pristis pectinata]
MTEMSSLSAVSLVPASIQLNQTAECEVNKIFQYKFLSITYAVVFLVGFSTNSLVLACLCLRRRKWVSGNLFVFNLALADLLYVITLPFFVVYYAGHGRWIFGKGVCRISRLAFHLNLYGSIGFLTCISVQRYLGIVHPMKVLGRWKTRHSALISLLVWALVLIQTGADLYFTKTNADSSKCYDTTRSEELTSYLLYVRAVSVTGFLIPFLLIIGCYCRIAVVLSKKHSLDTGPKERSRNLAIIIMLLFSVCFAPYHVLRYLNLMSRHVQWKGLCTRNTRSVYLFYQITRGLTSLNSCIDPFIYFVARDGMVAKMRTFRVKVRGFFIRRNRSSVPQGKLLISKIPARNETVV